jgi:hypothetical protein
VSIEHFVDVGRVVLAGNGEQDAAIVQRQQSLLERLVGAPGIDGVELDAVDTILAGNAAPEGIVKVENDALPWRRLSAR